MCSSVVRTGDSSEPFVTGCVPYLQFNFISVKGKGLEAKVNPNSRQKHLAELIISVAHDY
jgi:hypothetical protein